ncbi:MAG: bifunctional nuclease family protein [Raineya sp.]|nr:bifunctional nuclease family protein [Raineya sp.]
MSKIRLEILGLSSSQAQSGSFALVLGEKNGSRRLPIIIGMFEAQAIAIEIERITPNRPMTHDLFRSMAEAFEIRVIEVVISDLREGVFFAKLICVSEDRKIEIDARPSDAIAIALRFNAPVYTFENVLTEAGIILTDEDEEEEEDDRLEEVTPIHRSDSLRDYSTEQLQTLLNEALENEDYERAAKIRDELGKRGF